MKQKWEGTKENYCFFFVRPPDSVIWLEANGEQEDTIILTGDMKVISQINLSADMDSNTMKRGLELDEGSDQTPVFNFLAALLPFPLVLLLALLRSVSDPSESSWYFAFPSPCRLCISDTPNILAFSSERTKKQNN